MWWRGLRGVALALSLATVASAQSANGRVNWVATWGTAQQSFQLAPSAQAATPSRPSASPPPQVPAPSPPPGAPARRFGSPPRIAGLNDQTLRLHPGDAGYRLLAPAFDLALFAPTQVAPAHPTPWILIWASMSD